MFRKLWRWLRLAEPFTPDIWWTKPRGPKKTQKRHLVGKKPKH